MPRPVTLTDAQHAATLRALLRTLADQLAAAGDLVEQLLAPDATPTDQPTSTDAASMLAAARRTLDALDGHGWPLAPTPTTERKE